MAKRTVVKSVRASYRLPVDVASRVEVLADDTGWSEAKAAAFLIECGTVVLHETSRAELAKFLDGRRVRYVTAAGVHKAVTAAAESVRKARSKARAAVAAVPFEPNLEPFEVSRASMRKAMGKRTSEVAS